MNTEYGHKQTTYTNITEAANSTVPSSCVMETKFLVYSNVLVFVHLRRPNEMKLFCIVFIRWFHDIIIRPLRMHCVIAI